MEVKMLEIRDRATFVPVVAVLLEGSNDQQRKLLRSAGFRNSKFVLLSKLDNYDSKYDSYEWYDRTMSTAHLFIENNFHKLKDGDVVDVEYILGETTTKKEPQ